MAEQNNSGSPEPSDLEESEDPLTFERRNRTHQIELADELLRSNTLKNTNKKLNKLDFHYKRRVEKVQDKPKFNDLTEEEQQIYYPGRMNLSQLLWKRKAALKVMETFKHKVRSTKGKAKKLRTIRFKYF